MQKSLLLLDLQMTSCQKTDHKLVQCNPIMHCTNIALWDIIETPLGYDTHSCLLTLNIIKIGKINFREKYIV